jgi:restriction endonuclease Mrr
VAITKYDEIQIEALKLLKDGIPRKAKEFIDPLAVVFQLSENDLSKEYESGKYLILSGMCFPYWNGDSRQAER